MQTTDTNNSSEWLNAYLHNQDKFVDLTNWGLVKISGEKVVSFLQGQVTCDVTKINPRQGSLSALCNHQGRVLVVFYLLKKEDNFYCILPSSMIVAFIQHLSKFAVFSKVKLEDVTSKAFLYVCIGDNVSKKLSQKFPDLPHEMNEVSENGNAQVIKLSKTIPTYLIWSCESFPENEVQADDVSWKLLNIHAGRAFIYTETKSIATPHMLNLHLMNAVSFTKGCYVGQEIIARTQYLGKSKRHLCRAQLSVDIDLMPGEVIHSEDQEAGVLIEAVNIKAGNMLLVVLQSPTDRIFTLKGHVLTMVENLSSSEESNK